MALKGTGEFARVSSSNYSTMTLVGRYELVSQDRTNNRSTIKLHLYFQYTGTTCAASSSDFRAGKGAVSTNYKNYTQVYTKSYSYTGASASSEASYHYLGSTNITVTHNANGTFPDTNVGIYGKDSANNFTGQGKTGTLTSTQIPKIPRQSTLGIEVSSSYHLNETIEMPDAWNLTVTGLDIYTHKLYYSATSGTFTNYVDLDDDTLVSLHLNQANYNSDDTPHKIMYTYTDKQLYQQMITNEVTSIPIYLRLITYNGETQIGYNDYTINYSLPYAPISMTFTYLYGDSVSYQFTGNDEVFIKNFTRPRIWFNPAYPLEATLDHAVYEEVKYGSSYTASTDDYTFTNPYSDTNNEFKVTAYDTRGTSISSTGFYNQDNLTFINYDVPVINDVTAERTEATSTTANVSCTGTYSNVNFGQASNTVTSLLLKYKKGSDSDYTTVNVTSSATISNGTFSYSGTVTGIPTDDTCEVKFVVTDSLGKTYDLSEVVTKGIHIFEIGDGYFNVNGDLAINDTEVPCFVESSVEQDGTRNVNLYDYQGNRLVVNTGQVDAYTKQEADNKFATISSVPTTTSQLTNNSGFITNVVDNLTNYYKKTETYTKTEVDNLIGAISTMSIQVVQTLPTQDISTTTIYFVPKTTTGTNDVYEEYIYVNNNWELIGTTEIDLSDYVTDSDLTAALQSYALITDVQNNKNLTKGIEYIIGTQTAATNAWVGTSTDTGCSNSTMYVGKTIVYHLPVAGNTSAATLNLTLPDGTTTGAKTIYRLNNTTVTTTFAAGCDILMIWNGTNWKVNAYVDTNSNTIGYQLRTNSALWANKTGNKMNRYTLLFEVDGGLSGAATTISTGTTKVTVPFKYIPGGVIKYYSTSGDIANGSNFGATGLWDVYTVNLGYTFNTGTTLTSGKPVYMRCSVNSDGTLTPNYSGSPSHPIAQDLPDSADGYVYVYLGQAYSTSSIELLYNHPIYEFKDGRIREWQYDKTITSSDVTSALGYTPYNSTNPNGYTSNTGTITSVKMNGNTIATTGEANLGTVLTSHQNIKTINSESLVGTGNINLVTSSDLNDYVLSSSLATVATSGSYNDLTNKPTIPTIWHEITENCNIWELDKGSYISNPSVPKEVTFQLANSTLGIDTITKKPVYLFIGDKHTYTASPSGGTIQPFFIIDNVTGYTHDKKMWYGCAIEQGTYHTCSIKEVADKSEIPTALSDLTNDTGFITGITSSDITTALGYTPYNSSNPNGYITSSALSPYVLASSLSSVATSGSYNDLTNKPTIPTLLSQLTNDTGFIDKVATPLTSNFNVWSLNEGIYVVGNTNFDGTNYVRMTTWQSEIDGDNISYIDFMKGYLFVKKELISGVFPLWTWEAINILEFNNMKMYTGAVTKPEDSSVYIGSCYEIDLTDIAKASEKQDKLVSGTNIKTINNTSLLGSGNINISTGGTATDVQINGTSITSNYVANLVTQSAYNSSTNKIATKNDIPTNNNQLTNGAGYITGITSSMVTTALGYTPYNSTNPNGYTSNTGTITGIKMNGSTVASSGEADLGTVITAHQDIKTINNTSLVGTGNISLPTSSDIPTKVSDLTNDSGFISGISSSDVTSALGYTPYNSTNPSGYITSSALSPYVLASSLATVATSGSYNDLSDKPTIPSVGNSKTWYGTSATSASTQTKAVTCSGFTLSTGDTIVVTFTNAQSYNGQPKLNVNSTGAINIQYKSGTAGIRYMWNAGSTIEFVYDGTNFVCEGRDLATTTYYGITKLSDSTSSTSTSLAATANAVKKAYDLADGKQDALVSGTNIKTINGTSLLGSGDITVGGGGTATDVQINGTSIVSNGVANLYVSGAYSETNKLATLGQVGTWSDVNAGYISLSVGGTGYTLLRPDSNKKVYMANLPTSSSISNDSTTIPTTKAVYDAIPTVPSAGTSASAVSTTASGGSASTYSKSDHVHSISSSTITSALGYTPYNSTNPNGYISGITSSMVTSALGYTPYNSTNPNGYTSNTGTITSVKMNGSVVSSSGQADLGTVITSHQDISGKEDKTNKIDAIDDSRLSSTYYPTENAVCNFVDGWGLALGLQIAGKQDAISDTGWQTLTLASGFSAATGTPSSTPQYRKIGNHVFIRGTITFTRSNSTQIFATAASDYLPGAWVYKIACVQGTRLARIGCNPSTGQMFIDWIYPTNSTTAVTSGSITWLDITMDWFTD